MKGIMDAADTPLENRRQERGSFARALEVASCKIKLQAAVQELNKGYWAKSTLAVKMSRREEVTTLARTVAGQNQFLPLRSLKQGGGGSGGRGIESGRSGIRRSIPERIEVGAH